MFVPHGTEYQLARWAGAVLLACLVVSLLACQPPNIPLAEAAAAAAAAPPAPRVSVPTTTEGLKKIANIAFKRNDFIEARLLYARALEVEQAKSGSPDREMLGILHSNLSITMFQLGEYTVGWLVGGRLA